MCYHLHDLSGRVRTQVANRLLSAIASIAVSVCLVCSVVAQEELPLPPSVLVPNEHQQGAGRDLEELARGPIHEAFAEQVNYDPIPGIIVPKEPPPPIPELPPEYKPEGEGYVFISGYWFWDETREDFIWVSGGYRQLPPDTVWIDGYWHKVADGWQRVSGFYSLADKASVSYHRTPPPSLENGPIGPAPSADHMWSPGYWAPYEGEFVWRPGYWQVCRPGWVWVPRFWRWTPRGCVLVGGYWDYPWDARGYCFAPVYFCRPIYLEPGWCYRPRILLRNIAVQFHWFVRPIDCHYYFGDWYDVVYFQRGFIPGFQFHVRTRGLGFDPCFAYNQWYFGRQGLDYLAVSVQWNRFFVNHVDLRPPTTFVVQNNVIQNINNVSINNITVNNTTIYNNVLNQTVLADTIQNAARQRIGREGWRQIEANDLAQLTQVVERSRKTQHERAQAESAAIRLATLRAADADTRSIEQLEQLSREQQIAAREARQRASEQVTRRLNADAHAVQGSRAGWQQLARGSQPSDRDLIHRLERQLPQVAIGQTGTDGAIGRVRPHAGNNPGRTVELDPPRGTGRLGINTSADDNDHRGRGTGWRSPGDAASSAPGAGRGLTPAPDLDRNELERRLNNRMRNEQGNPTAPVPPVVRGQSRASGSNSDMAINPPRPGRGATGTPNNPGVINQGQPNRNVPPMNDDQPGRGTGWQERRGGRGNESSRQTVTPHQENSSVAPRNGGSTAQPRHRNPPGSLPNGQSLPPIDRGELERRAAHRNAATETAPRGGWNQPRSGSSRQNLDLGGAANAHGDFSLPGIEPPSRSPAAMPPGRSNRTAELNSRDTGPRARGQQERSTLPARVQPERFAPGEFQPSLPQREQWLPGSLPELDPAGFLPRPNDSHAVMPNIELLPSVESARPPRAGWSEQRGGENRGGNANSRGNSRQGGGRKK